MLDTVVGILGRATGLLDGGSEVVYECRRCGLTVDARDGRPGECPNCGPEAEFVRYEFD